MAEQTSIAHLFEAERLVVFENVCEYISDVATLASLTLVSKQARNTVYRSNGLREIKVEVGAGAGFACRQYCREECTTVNKVHIEHNSIQTVKEGVQWLWTIGKRLKVVRLLYEHTFNVVISVLSNLATTEKRRIETIEIRVGCCDWTSDLVWENRYTLRFLILGPSIFNRFGNGSFLSAVHQCNRLESFHISLDSHDGPTPLNFLNFLRETPLKHLSLSAIDSSDWVYRKFVEVLSTDDLRNNLGRLTLDYPISQCCLRLVEELKSSHPLVFVKVTELSFCFLLLCQQPKPINWLAFWAVFPAVNTIKDNFKLFYDIRDSVNLTHNLSSFCKTYFEASGSRLRDIKIEIPDERYCIIHRLRLRAAVAKAATLPDDQAWCLSHGVQIETETRGEKVVRVTLRKDTSTLVFELCE